MNVFERYFQRNEVRHRLELPSDTGLIVVIPVLEDPDIFDTIDSLCQCVLPAVSVGVVIVVNNAENKDSRENRLLAARIKEITGKKNRFAEQGVITPCLKFEVLEEYALPVKYAGVGLARKIGMDAAARYFYNYQRENGVIVSLDADTLVDTNYFTALLTYFQSHPVAGVSVAYAHLLSNCDTSVKQAIVCYELYLRYYKSALEYTGHPYAFHCIGSAFAVRVSDYVAQGGMNRKQAGEDFYFLQKLMSTGRYADLVTTHVYPSPRISERTPFGTGRAVRQIIADDGTYETYDFEAFLVLKMFFTGIDELYKSDELHCKAYWKKQPECLCAFLPEREFAGMIREVSNNSASHTQFRKRFFDTFNAFRVLKYLNFVHEGYFKRADVNENVAKLLKQKGIIEEGTSMQKLEALRRLQEIP